VKFINSIYPVRSLAIGNYSQTVIFFLLFQGIHIYDYLQLTKIRNNVLNGYTYSELNDTCIWILIMICTGSWMIHMNSDMLKKLNNTNELWYVQWAEQYKFTFNTYSELNRYTWTLILTVSWRIHLNFDTYCEHVMALVIYWPLLFFNVEFAEEVEGYDSVNVDHHTGQHHCQHQLPRKGTGLHINQLKQFTRDQTITASF
jgi:hypothetical protein